jgi:hypothetical protein
MGLMAAPIKSAVKGAVVMIFSRMGIRPPQDRDTLDFAVEQIVKLTLDALEHAPIELHAEEVEANE